MPAPSKHRLAALALAAALAPGSGAVTGPGALASAQPFTGHAYLRSVGPSQLFLCVSAPRRGAKPTAEHGMQLELERGGTRVNARIQSRFAIGRKLYYATALMTGRTHKGDPGDAVTLDRVVESEYDPLPAGATWSSPGSVRISFETFRHVGAASGWRIQGTHKSDVGTFTFDCEAHG